jgi:hypothetical protein
MENAQSEPVERTASDQSRWHIVTEVPLPAPPTDNTEWLLEGEFVSVEDAPLVANGGNGAAPAQSADGATLWDELDALMQMPQPPVAPANTVFTERYVRRARRRATWRRVRRMAVAAAFGALLGAAVWVWAPLGWQHPITQPIALPHLGQTRPLGNGACEAREAAAACDTLHPAATYHALR